MAPLPLRLPQQDHPAPAPNHRAPRHHRQVSRRPAPTRLRKCPQAHAPRRHVRPLPPDHREQARKTIPNLVLRTSFIVGFPGETEADFNELCAFVEAAKIDWLGVFSYSDEEGAGAFSLDEKVPKRTIESRRRKLMKLQQRISKKARKAMGRPRARHPRRRRIRRDRPPLARPLPRPGPRDRRQSPHQRLRPPRSPSPRHLLPRPDHRVPRLRRSSQHPRVALFVTEFSMSNNEKDQARNSRTRQRCNDRLSIWPKN